MFRRGSSFLVSFCVRMKLADFKIGVAINTRMIWFWFVITVNRHMHLINILHFIVGCEFALIDL